jgi:15-cis-phytoene synthase
MTDPAPALDGAYALCEALVREADRDRWLAALFVPENRRRNIFALNAYSIELARVRDIVHDPMPGEIRLQWWVDTVGGHGHGDVTGHPVAAAMLDTVSRFALPRAALASMAEARRFDLYDDPMPSLNDLEGYAGETASALIQQCAIVLAEGEDPRSSDASGHAGVAWALVGLMRALPVHARRGQCYLPIDLLARHGADPAMVRSATAQPAVAAALAELREHARHHLNRALAAILATDRRVRPAFVILGLIEPYLRALERQSDPFAAIADVAAWRKPLALWRFSRRIASGGVRR